VFRDVTADFVDREKELALFHQMLEGSVDKQLLLISERGEQGKSYFLHRLAYECEQQSPPVPAVYLDFDQRKGGLTDYLGVARAVRRQLGDTNTPAVCACEKAIYRPAPLVNIQTGTSSGSRVDLGKKTKLDDAELSEIAGRDNISVGDVSGGAPASADPAAQRAAMGRALCSDLEQLSETHPRAVVLIDTFEHVSDETCGWLESWLFERLHDDLPHVLVVVAGRPERCRQFFAPARVWSRVITSIYFEPINDDDIRIYYHRRNLAVSEAEIPLLLDLARESPMAMAQLGDKIERTRGVGR
jgi:hypothetical protein